MLEFAIALPLIAALLGGSYMAWSALHTSIELTSAAHAGAIVAAYDIRTGGNSAANQATALADATAAVNNELGASPDHYAPGTAPCTDCVTLWETCAACATGNLIVIQVYASIVPVLPLVSGFQISAVAGTSYGP